MSSKYMPDVRIEAIPGPITYARVFINGVEVPGLRKVVCSIPYDDVAEVTLTIICKLELEKTTEGSENANLES